MCSVLEELSQHPDGIIEDKDLLKLLKENYRLSMQEINFLRRDLRSAEVVVRIDSRSPAYYRFWKLTESGWVAARKESERRRSERPNTLYDVMRAGLPSAARYHYPSDFRKN
jgi:hypothetical protein